MAPTTTVIGIHILPAAPGSSFSIQGEQNIVVFDGSADGLSAVTGGTIATATLVTARINRFTTVASTGACRLPPALPGMKIEIFNGQSSNALSVFPAGASQGGVSGGDNINAVGAGSAYSLTAAYKATFECLTTGQWYAQQGALS